MDSETSKILADLEAKIVSIEVSFKNEVERLNKLIDEDRAHVVRYMEQHSEYHHELYRKISASYARTHPEVIDTLIQCDKILGVGAPPKASR